jgi:carbamoyltransferase
MGINSVYHESAVCLLRGEEVLAFAEEERFNRTKHAKPARVGNSGELPVNAIDYCLREAGAGWNDVDYVALPFDPALRSAPIEEPVVAGDWGHPDGEKQFLAGVAGIPAGLSGHAGTDLASRVRYVPHELAHAASCYYPSPYADAAVMSLDGIGEWSTGLLAYGEGVTIKELRRLAYPDSVGFLWEKFSKFVGLGEYEAAKVMALAAFASPDHFAPAMRSLVRDPAGGLRISLGKLRFRAEDYSGLEELFGKRRQRGEPIDTRDALVAAALQQVTEEILLEMCDELAETTGSENLCLAGGVALNCVANGRIARDSRFKRIFVQPMAHDAGTALGAAAYVNHNLCQGSERYQMTTPYLGPAFSEADMTRALQDADLAYDRMSDTAATVARLLADGRIGGWFQGRAEVGPRALGNRSILADPRNQGSKELINLRAKHREYFRPFAPSVLEESAREWFAISGESPSHQFMSFAFDVREEKRGLVPAVLHVDGSSRLQTVSKLVNPKFHALISHFEKLTGVPMLLNTSFNSYYEPIVLSPRDAINTFDRSGLDFLVLGDFLVTAPVSGGDRRPRTGR